MALSEYDAALVPLPRWVRILGWAALATFCVAQVYGLLVSPPERDMGHLQKIMYVHFPGALTAFAAFSIVFIASLLYLFVRRQAYDLLATSAAEVGVLLTGLTIILGSIWGRSTWGVWWTWDPRLTTTAVMLVIYVGYLSLRAFIDDEERRARWSAAIGTIGFLNVWVVYMSVRWWRSIHQVQSSPETVDPVYVTALRLHFVAFLLLLVSFVSYRYYIARLELATEARMDERALEGSIRHV